MAFRHIVIQSRSFTDREWQFLGEVLSAITSPEDGGVGLCDHRGRRIDYSYDQTDTELSILSREVTETEVGDLVDPAGGLNPGCSYLGGGKGDVLRLSRAPKMKKARYFCNTKDEPYDVVVVACILAATVAGPEVISFYTDSDLPCIYGGAVLLARKTATPSLLGKTAGGRVWVRPRSEPGGSCGEQWVHYYEPETMVDGAAEFKCH